MCCWPTRVNILLCRLTLVTSELGAGSQDLTLETVVDPTATGFPGDRREAPTISMGFPLLILSLAIHDPGQPLTPSASPFILSIWRAEGEHTVCLFYLLCNLSICAPWSTAQ